MPQTRRQSEKIQTEEGSALSHANNGMLPLPRFRADIIGSFIRPPELRAAQLEHRDRTKGSAHGQGKPASLVALEDQSIREVVALQERCGLKVVTDGEFRRGVFFDFIKSIGGIRIGWGEGNFGFEGGGATPRVNVTGPLVWPEQGITVGDFKFLRTVAKVTPKAMLPSPLTAQFHNLYRADWIESSAYQDPEAFWSDMTEIFQKEIAALAEAGCTYLQLDETALIKLCDAKYVAHLREANIDPNVVVVRWIEILNACVAAKPKGMTIAMHMCRGNGPGGRWLAEGSYEPVAEAIFNQLAIDVFMLEYDTDRAGSFEPLRYFPNDKGLVLGLITTKSPELESPDYLVQRIEMAAKYVPLERLGLSPQCGFASDVEGNPLNSEDQARKLSLVVEVANDVWG